MARPLRIEFPGAVYHVTSRGDRREPIAKDDSDRALFLQILGEAAHRFDARVWAYCLMDNHYHLVLQTREANLSRMMRQVNGVYTQAFNRRHNLSGHLFQGRFKAILVDRDSYLLEVCRYVDLNPVRASMVQRPEAYAWSSYRALAGLADSPDWLDAQPVYDQLAPNLSANLSAKRAATKYAEFVAQGKGVPLWDKRLRQQIYLGDDAFIVRMQKLAGYGGNDGAGTPKQRGRKSNLSKIHTRAPKGERSPQHYAALKTTDKAQRNQNMADAFYQGGHTLTDIAHAFGLSLSTVSRVVDGFERG